MSESPALRSTDKSHESVWKRSLSSIIAAVSPGAGTPYSRTAEISRAMIDSVFEGGSDLRSSEPEAQPVRPARKSNRRRRWNQFITRIFLWHLRADGAIRLAWRNDHPHDAGDAELSQHAECPPLPARRVRRELQIRPAFHAVDQGWHREDDGRRRR
jgi:hypothetical protein